LAFWARQEDGSMASLPQEVVDALRELPSTYDALRQHGRTEPPSSTDERFERVLAFYTTVDDDERRQEVRRRLDEHFEDQATLSHFLLGFGKRMAVLAIRTMDASKLFPGLLALVLEDLRFDDRDTLVHLSFLQHAALKVGAESLSLLRRAEQYGSPQCRELFRQVARRRPRLSSIKGMGYEEGTSEHGFVFVPRG
jgi:hypothetical protein